MAGIVVDATQLWKHRERREESPPPPAIVPGSHNDCEHAPNKQLCLPPSYSKFELPFTETVNIVEIGIEILDVLRINDKVGEAGIVLALMRSDSFPHPCVRK